MEHESGAGATTESSSDADDRQLDKRISGKSWESFISCCTNFKAERISVGGGIGRKELVRHQLTMADLRARLGMMVVKSTVEWRVVGLKEREIQARTQLRSKVWPEETMTGSAISSPEMGQTNSGGGDGFL